MGLGVQGADLDSAGPRKGLAKLPSHDTKFLQQRTTGNHTVYHNGGLRQTKLGDRWQRLCYTDHPLLPL
jgi:hypothetical protein